MTVPVKYKQVDSSLLSIEKPVKIDGVYTSTILYDGKHGLSIQTPVIELQQCDKVQFGLIKKGQLFTCFEEMHDKLSDLLYIKSKDFFNKSFSEQRIKDSFTKFVSIDEGLVTFNNVSIKDDIKVYNSFMDSIPLVYPLNAIAILRLDKLVFRGTKIEYVIDVTHVKMDFNSNKKKILNCILDDSDEDQDADKDYVEVDEHVTNETEENEIDELDTIIKNVDLEDYFEDKN